MIALMDLSLSVDNVVAAIALSPNELWPVYVGVTIGIIALRLIAGVAVKMITKYPVLEHTAFILVGYVGLLLITELQFHDWFHDLGPTKVKIIKFAGILGLVALTLLWSEKPWVRTLLNPLLRIFVLPMQIFASLVGAILVLITWPVKKLIAVAKKA
jgi:predicted tellurium resistance membrane protein TerC